ncbi:MAG: F0F1 ATP synthase subunit B [Bacillota bacterium]|nr:F0F1 ATP synthase subunit B [Bacillota bacterium]
MINPLYMLQVLLSFFVLMGLLTYFLYKPVRKFMADRTASIEKTIKDAHKAKEDAEKLRSDYQGELAQAKAESQRIIEDAIKQGQKVREQMTIDARAEAARLIEKAKAEVQLELDKAMAVLRDHVAELAISAAAAVISKDINADTHAQLIADVIQGVGKH